jgi:hypothetical protein
LGTITEEALPFYQTMLNRHVGVADQTGASGEIMKTKVIMPARLMSDGFEQDLFGRFAIVAQRIGVYTAYDYVDIIEHLVKYWNIAGVSGILGEGMEARVFSTAGRRDR